MDHESHSIHLIHNLFQSKEQIILHDIHKNYDQNSNGRKINRFLLERENNSDSSWATLCRSTNQENVLQLYKVTLYSNITIILKESKQERDKYPGKILTQNHNQ